MPDISTLRDHNRDLMTELAMLKRKAEALRKELDRWRRTSEILSAFIATTSSDLPAGEIMLAAFLEANNG